MIEKIFNIGECEKLTTLNGKLTVVINTFDNGVEKIACSILSLFQNSKSVNGFLEHVIVCIHGPDSRTGDTKSQDAKQSFLEDLRTLKWRPIGSDEERDMPLTIIRVWSRVGIGQSLDMAMPWIHTEYVLVISEEYRFLNDSWIDYLQDKLKNFDFLYDYEEENFPSDHQYFCSKYKIDFFATSKKLIEKNGVRWTDYSVFGDFVIQDKNIKNLVAQSGSWAKRCLADYNGKRIDLDYLRFLGKYNNNFFDFLIKKDFLIQLEKNKEYNRLYRKYYSPNEKTFDVIERYKNENFDNNLKILVAVCVYDRFRSIANWLRAWNNCNKYGAKLAVVHSWGLLNCKNEFNEIPNEDQKELILSFKPDYYISRRNNGMDIAAFKDMLNNKDVGDWDVLIWFTDDCLPVDKDFLRPFLVEMSNPNIGLVGAFPSTGFYRTVSFAIRKDVMKKIPYVNNGNIITREDCLYFEQLLTKQVKNAGYEIVAPSLDSSIEIQNVDCNSFAGGHIMGWIWDYQYSLDTYGKMIVEEFWKHFENQFEDKDRIENSLEHLESFKARYRS